MLWFLAFLSGIGISSSTPEPPLPLALAAPHFEPAPPEPPEIDAFWPVSPLEEAFERVAQVSGVLRFIWPEAESAQQIDSSQAPVGETSDRYYLTRLELGSARMRQMELEPRFFPALSRAVLGVPMGLIEALTDATVPEVVVVKDKQVLNQVAATEDLATITGRTILKAEMNFLGSLPTSYINTVGVQNGTEDYDRKRLMRLQWRALFNAVKNGYRERYQIPSLDLDTILSAMSTGDWIDFITLPAAVSIYAARFGIDRRIRVSDDIRMELQIEKATRFQKVLTSNHGGRLVAASFNFYKLPLSFIVSLEGAPHGVGYEFIGIGTDINSALCAVLNYEGPRDADGHWRGEPSRK